MALELNLLNNEIVLREMTSSEITEQDFINDELKETANQALLRFTARQSALAKLATLGLTEEEIAAL